METLFPRDVRAFHKNFCKMQQLAQKYAIFFNDKLLSLPGVDPSKVPPIRFLECWETGYRSHLMIYLRHILTLRSWHQEEVSGVLDTNVSPPVFELTDPAIHYKERTQRVDFGRTYCGEDGIENIFQSHKCSALCRM
ncbi:hypothetical protein ACHAXR_001550, partial [Thalassiosira sp. AJA248-18]